MFPISECHQAEVSFAKLTFTARKTNREEKTTER